MRDWRERSRREKGGSDLTELVEGRPISMDGRELVPLVRVTRWARRRAQLREDEVGGQGYGFIHMKPVGIVERDETAEWRHAICDETARAIRWLMLAALLMPLVTALFVAVARKLAGNPSPDQPA